MAKSTTVERNNFVRGLISEAGPLTFPENASIDEVNFALNRDGSRQRRLGLDYETDYTKISTGSAFATMGGNSSSTFPWVNINNDSTVSLAIVQIGAKLWFFDLLQEAQSSSIKNSGNPLDLGALYGVNAATKLQYAAVNGILILTCADSVPIMLEYDEDTDTISSSRLSLKVRDMWGIASSFDVSLRPTFYSIFHHYNLLNNGWTQAYIDSYLADNSVYPSKAMQLHLGKNATGDISWAIMNQQFFGNTPAPNGHFIIDAFTRGASRLEESGLAVSSETEYARPAVCASFAGRMFYSGIKSRVVLGDAQSPNFTGSLLFTQLVDSNAKLEYCYQEADPTSEHISDLVATDGGILDIISAKNITKLIARETSLLVIAENGIWEITGPDGIFKANDYSLSHVTTLGASSADSVVEVEGAIYYWSDAGIIQLAPDNVSGKLVATNITEASIQTLYKNIPSVGKLYATVNYDSSSRTVSWLYNDEAGYTGNTFRNKYNKELRLDLVLNAWYIYEIGALAGDSVYVAGYIPTDSFVSTSIDTPVYVGADDVDAATVDVVITDTGRGISSSKTKYLCVIPDTTYSFTFGFYKRDDFYDWYSEDGVGVDANAFVITGYELFGETQRNKSINYLTMHFKRTEDGFTDDGLGNLTPTSPSSCLVRARWDWHGSAAGGKWGTQFQAYRPRRSYMPEDALDTYDTGEQVITTKNRVRGTGKAFSMRIDTEAGKDLHLYGWGLVPVGGERV